MTRWRSPTRFSSTARSRFPPRRFPLFRLSSVSWYPSGSQRTSRRRRERNPVSGPRAPLHRPNKPIVVRLRLPRRLLRPSRHQSLTSRWLERLCPSSTITTASPLRRLPPRLSISAFRPARRRTQALRLRTMAIRRPVRQTQFRLCTETGRTTTASMHRESSR